MLKILAILFGILMIAAGILGFIPEYTQGNKLLGLFTVNTTHNIVHILTGVVALLCGFSGTIASKIFFIIFGLVYGAIAALGFYYGEGILFNYIAVNHPDNWLHTGIAIISLAFGFLIKR